MSRQHTATCTRVFHQRSFPMLNLCSTNEPEQEITRLYRLGAPQDQLLRLPESWWRQHPMDDICSTFTSNWNSSIPFSETETPPRHHRACKKVMPVWRRPYTFPQDLLQAFAGVFNDSECKYFSDFTRLAIIYVWIAQGYIDKYLGYLIGMTSTLSTQVS